MTPNNWITNPDTRRYIYAVLMAVGVALVGMNVLAQETWVHIANIVGAVLLTGGHALARTNVPEPYAGPIYEDEDDSALPVD